MPGAAVGNPAPCIEVGSDAAVLKDRVGATQILLIPTARITGIEDPRLLQPGVPNYFASAWAARRFVEQRAGHPLPRDAFALAINPPGARSQNQLHIHIDCIQPAVRETLRSQALGPAWTMLDAKLAGQRYRAIRLNGTDLTQDPFALLAETSPGGRTAMARTTLVLTGTGDPARGDGFVLLAGELGVDGGGHGEDLEDHGCAIAR